MGASLDAIYAEVLRLNEKLEALPGLIEVNANQVKVVSLDELSETLGLLKAGEFRSGNLRVPGDSFSGMRIGYPGFQYPGTSTASSDLYNLVGVDVDTLQVGIRSSDGVLVAGGGIIELSALGIRITEGAQFGNMIKWQDTNISEGIVGSDLLAYVDAANLLNTDAIGGEGSDIVQTWLELVSQEADTSGTPTTSDMGYGVIDLNTISSNANTRMTFGAFNDTTAIPYTGSFFRLRHHIGGFFLGPATSTDDRDADMLWVDTAFSEFTLRFGSLTSTTASRGMNVAFMNDLSTSLAGAWWSGDNLGFIFGGSDTTTFDIGWLAEKALTFASTATAGIEDPDNEMGKLWLDTNAEMRLTDTAGEDWYVTKSTSTGGGSQFIWSGGTGGGNISSDLLYYSPSGLDAAGQVIKVGYLLPTACTLTDFRVRSNDAVVAAGATRVFAIAISGSTTANAITLSSGEYDEGSTFAVALSSADGILIEHITTGNPGISIANWALTFSIP